MKKINVLFLSAGRRVELLKCFQKAAEKLHIDSKITAGDCSKTAPALYFADRICALPRIDDPQYISAIIEVCQRDDISVIIPTIDTDLLLLAENKDRIEKETNAKIMISDYKVIAICQDKINTQSFLDANGFGVPKLYDIDQLSCMNGPFPVFMKPKSGSSSIDAYRVNNSDELSMYHQLIKDPMIQEYVKGEEYTVDVFLDFSSNVISIVPRLRMATRSGEISKGRIVKDPEIINDVKRLMTILKPIGHITVQLMKTAEGIIYIEINPRFGGGAPMSIQSGADSCENIYCLLMGQELTYHEHYQDNLTFLRFDSSICLNANMERIE